MSNLIEPCTQEQVDFALHYREMVLPRLMVLCRGWAALVGKGEAEWNEASGSLMLEAVRLGATRLHPADFSDLEKYLGDQLASMALAAEFAAENARGGEK